MTTYVYETVPSQPGQKPRYFEIQQRMKDAPLTKHSESGEPIRRVVLGGFWRVAFGIEDQTHDRRRPPRLQTGWLPHWRISR